MTLMRDQEGRTSRHRSLRTRTTAVLAAVVMVLGSLGVALGGAGPASAASPSSFPVSTDDCRGGGWADFTGIDFRNQGQCVTWVQHTIVHEECLDAALADFQDDGATYAAQLGIPLGDFLSAVCRGQDFPVSNAWYVIDDPAGTDLLSLASGNTAAFVTQPGNIYWIQVQGAWFNGAVRQADAKFISDDGWATWVDGPSWNPLNLETQVNGQFVDWGMFNADHHYSYWILGDGNPINMRVFDGDPDTNTPNPAWYVDNVGTVPVADHEAMPAIVFEYELTTP